MLNDQLLVFGRPLNAFAGGSSSGLACPDARVIASVRQIFDGRKWGGVGLIRDGMGGRRYSDVSVIVEATDCDFPHVTSR